MSFNNHLNSWCNQLKQINLNCISNKFLRSIFEDFSDELNLYHTECKHKIINYR